MEAVFFSANFQRFFSQPTKGLIFSGAFQSFQARKCIGVQEDGGEEIGEI